MTSIGVCDNLRPFYELGERRPQINEPYHIRRIFPATDEVCARVEGLLEALAVPAEVVGQEVFVNLAAVPEDAVALAAAARPHLRDDKDAWIHGGAVGNPPFQAGHRQVQKDHSDE